MKKSFQLLVPSLADKSAQIAAFEQKTGCVLPPLYRIFLKNFDHGERIILREKMLVQQVSSWWYINTGRIRAVSNGLEILSYFEYFLDIDGLNQAWEVHQSEERYANHHFLVIGWHGDVASGRICLGYGEHNAEKIYGVMDEGYEDDPEFPFVLKEYGDNIFDFVSKLSEIRSTEMVIPAGTEPVYCCTWDANLV